MFGWSVGQLFATLVIIASSQEWGWGGSLHISSSCAKISLLTEKPLSRLSGSALKVCVVGGWLESKFSDRLWQKPSFS